MNRPHAPRHLFVASSGLGLALLAAGCPASAPSAPLPQISHVPSSVAPPAPPPATTARRYSDLMADVGRHFERAGRAADASRWELCVYDTKELIEVMNEDLPGAVPPEDAKADVKPLAQAFAASWPDQLKRAAESRDTAAFTTAYAHVAGACNGCHRAVGRPYIVIPEQLGAALPEIAMPAPLPAAPPKKPLSSRH